MNPLTKVVVVTTLVGSVVAGIAPNLPSTSLAAVMPHVRVATAQISQQIRAEVGSSLAASLNLVGITAADRARPLVTIDGNHMIVEARRLPLEEAIEVVTELRKAALRF